MSPQMPVKKRKRSREEILDSWNGANGPEIDLFVYGTLTSTRHVKLLLNRQVEMEPCQLFNYMKIVPPGAFYFIVRQMGAMVRGFLLKKLTADEIRRLDVFEDEGTLYFRRKVVVRTQDGFHRHCQTYIGNVPALQHSFAHDVHFEDRYNRYLERNIEGVLDEESEKGQTLSERMAMRELMDSEAESLIESQLDGDYICNYLMSQTFHDAKPPNLQKIFDNPEIRPYAGNYMEFVCRHIILNRIAEFISRDFLEEVRVSRKYFRHGVSILLALLYCNRDFRKIREWMQEKQLDCAVPGRSYLEYAEECIRLAEELYDRKKMQQYTDFLESNWYSTPTPLGAELEFSALGGRAVYAEPGEEPKYDAFYWFNDFDLQRRMWRLGGHVDSHMPDPGSNARRRGFLEYALGRFNIAADLSRPLFDCPWAMSQIINEAVKFTGIPPHSLHISMELPPMTVTDKRHKESDLACLLLLGGDLRKDETGILREMRIFRHELDTNSRNSLNFLDRKHHYSRVGENDPGSEVMEYKFLRLRAEPTDYGRIIAALKDYQFATQARPISIVRMGEKELPEQTFLREWAEHPAALSDAEINSFVSTVERGIKKEYSTTSNDKRRKKVVENIYTTLRERNGMISSAGKAVLPKVTTQDFG